METHSTEGDRSEREDNLQNRVRPSTPAYKSRRHVRASNNVRPYNIQEEVMEDIGTGVKSKLVIRDLDTAGECQQTEVDIFFVHCTYCIIRQAEKTRLVYIS